MSTFRDVAELQAQLLRLDAAIDAARSASSYSIGGRSLQRQELATLQNERTLLVRQIRQAEAALEGARSPGEAVASWHR